jgi:hypothetical protein
VYISVELSFSYGEVEFKQGVKIIPEKVKANFRVLITVNIVPSNFANFHSKGCYYF